MREANSIRYWCAGLTLLGMTFVATIAKGQNDLDAAVNLQSVQRLIAEAKFGEATEQLKAMVEAEPENGAAIFFLGYSMHMDGKPEEALEWHRKAVEFDDFAPIATYNIGCAQALLGNTDEAIEALAAAIELGFRDADQFASDSDLDRVRPLGEFAYLMARIAENNELEADLRRGQDLLNEEEFEAAVELYGELAKAHKENGFVIFRYGYSLHAAGEIEKALEVHQRAAEFEEFAGIAQYNAGCAHALLGETESALDALEKSIDQGFIRPEFMERDPDLESLREHEMFQALLSRAKEAVAEEAGE